MKSNFLAVAKKTDRPQVHSQVPSQVHSVLLVTTVFFRIWDWELILGTIFPELRREKRTSTQHRNWGKLYPDAVNNCLLQ